METLKIVALDRDTLADKPFGFDFKHELAEYGNTEPQIRRNAFKARRL